MEKQTENSGNVQETAPARVDVFRYQKWVDKDGRLFVVMLTFGMGNDLRNKAQIELLNVNTETTQDVGRAAFEDWVRSGTLRRFEGGFQLTI